MSFLELVKVYEINIDDIIRINPGNISPLDGIIINGSSDIDQKTLTGESFPVYKTQNDLVYAGTINLSAPIDIKVTTGEVNCVVRVWALTADFNGYAGDSDGQVVTFA